MNRLLALIVVVLIPIAVFSSKEDETMVLKGETLENISLEIPIENNIPEEDVKSQVLVSNNNDKSNPFYIDLEEYVVGVVGGEMPASFNMEALKAQAVAARTYALYKMQNIDGYVLSTTINDQVYLSKEKLKAKWGNEFDYYYERVKKAVEETKGQVLSYNGEIIIAYYFAISNGYTEPAQTVFKETRDYLVSVDSNWDKSYSAYSSTFTMLRSNFCAKLNIDCEKIVISNVVRSETGYVREITINNVKFTGIQLFNKLGLKSTDFTITVSGDNVVIKTNGFGHGVGMSQYGAQGMASKGYSYDKILKHYYKNTEIVNI
ncbi:MAG: stage II sporulation protein D [Bacilli bacterium]|nr:stage II sporulation protein D [Bacilli bacterium]